MIEFLLFVGLILGSIGAQIRIAALEREIKRGHCMVCYFESGLRVVNDPGHKHIPYFVSQR